MVSKGGPWLRTTCHTTSTVSTVYYVSSVMRLHTAVWLLIGISIIQVLISLLFSWQMEIRQY